LIWQITDAHKIVLSAKISECAENAATLDRDSRKALKVGQDYAINLTRLVAKEGEA